MHDCCVIGGGIIGLSIARELAGRGLRVQVLAREPEKQTASWAAAGIFPPAPWFPGAAPVDLLTAWSDELHREWARQLRDETGIDNGLSACGGLHVAAEPAGLERLREEADAWQAKGVGFGLLDAAGMAAVEPGLADAVHRGAVVGGYLLPDEWQIRPPRHLDALVRSCRQRGVEIAFGTGVESIAVRGGAIASVAAVHGDGTRATIRAGSYVVAAGAWTERLAATLGLTVETRPVRGQIALYRFARPPVERVVNLGMEYLVPRPDGRLLVGSTLEHAGFDPATTPTGLARLAAVATLLLGDLSGAVLEQSWAGLRPGSLDGLPTIGPIPGCGNGFIAAGHYRAGLHQSPGTAVLIADLVTGRTPPIDPAPFAADRPALTRR